MNPTSSMSPMSPMNPHLRRLSGACAALLLSVASCGLPEARPREDGVTEQVFPEFPGLTPATYFTGYVLDPFDFYLPRARVTLSVRDADGTLRRIDERFTDEWGVYELKSVATGEHVVEIESTAGRCDPIPFTIDAAADETVVTDIALEPTSTTILRGTLLGTDGLPIPADELAQWLADEGDALVGAGSRWCAWPTWHGWFAAVVNPDNARFEIEVPAGFDGAVRCCAGEQDVAFERWRDGDGLVELIVDRERFLAASTAARDAPLGTTTPVTDGVEQVFHFVLDAGQPFRRPSVVEGRVTIARADGSLVFDDFVLAPMDWSGRIDVSALVPRGPLRLRADFRPLLYVDEVVTIVDGGGEPILK